MTASIQHASVYLTADDIRYATAEYFGVLPIDLISERRGGLVPEARSVAMALTREVFGWSYPRIAERFAKAHPMALLAHRSVLHSAPLLMAFGAILETLRASVETRQAA